MGPLFIASLRLKILYRTINHAGWGLVLFALLLCTVIIIRSVTAVIDNPDWWWGLLLLAPALLWHFTRKDKHFLQIAGIPQSSVLLADYTLVGLIPLALLVYSRNWLGVLILLAGTALLAQAKIPEKMLTYRSNPALSVIPLDFFEWRCGIRQNPYFLAFMYLISLFNCCWVGGLALSVLLLSSLLVPFYDFIENKDILQKTFSVPDAFYSKLGKHLLLTLLTIAPHTLVYVIFNPGFWGIALACLVFMLSVVAFSLGLKYANWYVQRRRVVQGVPHAVFTAGLLSALLTLPALVWMVFVCIKANRNMNGHFINKN